jgi:hypothetical protein
MPNQTNYTPHTFVSPRMSPWRDRQFRWSIGVDGAAYVAIVRMHDIAIAYIPRILIQHQPRADDSYGIGHKDLRYFAAPVRAQLV